MNWKEVNFSTNRTEGRMGRVERGSSDSRIQTKPEKLNLPASAQIKRSDRLYASFKNKGR